MVILALLLIALACLTLGLLMQSAVWLAASLVATTGAGFLLFKLRDVIAAPKSTATRRHVDGEGGPYRLAVSVVTDSTISAADSAYPAGADAATGSNGVARQVWVIDGRPRYHLGDCAIIKGQDAEAIPYEQATEDGFMPCSLCEPYAARAH
jgi:hypothetical protein